MTVGGGVGGRRFGEMAWADSRASLGMKLRLATNMQAAGLPESPVLAHCTQGVPHMTKNTNGLGKFTFFFHDQSRLERTALKLEWKALLSEQSWNQDASR